MTSSSFFFLTSHVLLCGSAQTWCSFSPIWWSAGEITDFYGILAIFVSLGLKWIIYTYCMDKSVDVALLVVYYFNGGTLSIVLKAHLYSTTQIRMLVNVCFKHIMTFTVDRASCYSLQNTLINLNITVNFNKSNPTSSPLSETICKCVSTFLNIYK